MLRANRVFGTSLVLIVTILGIGVPYAMTQSVSPETRRQTAEREFSNGDFRDALGHFQALCIDPKVDSVATPLDLNRAIACLQQLGRIAEADALVENAIQSHPKNWRLLQTAAEFYLQTDHHGTVLNGRFVRGPHRGGGEIAHVIERDRTRALQLLAEAMRFAAADDKKSDVADFYFALSRHLLYGRGFQESWRLQTLTDLATLPDHELGYPFYRDATAAPVDEAGNPIYHLVPKSWEAAETDGQRWRWALEQVVENQPARRNAVRLALADFFGHQFGVESLLHGQFSPYWGRDDAESPDTQIFALHTLADDETIARLAVGIKRFKLPDEFNPLKIYRQMIEDAQLGLADQAMDALATAYENRRQFPKATEYWKQAIQQFGAGQDRYREARLNQLIGNWGTFESRTVAPAGTGATVDFRFRNANEVTFDAFPIDIPKLLDDIQKHIQSNPQNLDWEKVNIDAIGWRLVQSNGNEYLGKMTATWTEELKPRAQHFDRRISIATPLKKAGAYFVTARVKGGNSSSIVLWIADTAIVRKPLSGQSLYFVADAETGTPVAHADLEFFGWQPRAAGRRLQFDTTHFAEKTDDDGKVILTPNQQPQKYQWLTIARTKDGRLAFLGMHGVWGGEWYDQEYNQVKPYCITDRPVYRPTQKVQFKIWLRRAQYDQPNQSEFAHQELPLEIHDPRGQKIHSVALETDDYAGASGHYELPSDATLGVYQIVVPGYGGSSFRVEEYKKPEFEVLVDAPSEPVMLGEPIKAKIRAKYYFGAPVTKATVKYKIQRSNHDANWFPSAPWDWCFGPGYWWFSYDYSWYPGWSRWAGCMRPIPSWFPRHTQPPELVADHQVEMGPDGEVDVVIDTALAKAIHADHDHRYEITVEVRDESRRTIVGQGQVLVAREPFKVFSWVDRGYYRVGDTVHAHFQAQTLDRKPVSGRGQLKLLRITYDEKRQPIETPVQEWPLDSNAEGRADLQIKASAKGQYRLSYTVRDDAEHAIEGGYIFTIVGEGFDGHEFRFQDVELIPDQQEYAPDQKVRLQVNTDRPGSTVLLFVRPANGVYLPPKFLRLKGKSLVEEIAVIQKDMPNFFVEAVTVSGGRVHSELKEIVVPPEKRVLNVEVLPSQETYRPGEQAKVKIHVTDFTGENFVGSTVVSVYDKSLEYISGGSNVPDIKKFFWEWRRHHHKQDEHSLARGSSPLSPPNKPTMNQIGIFGNMEQDGENDVMVGAVGGLRRRAFAMAAPGGPPMAAAALAGAPANLAMGMSADQEQLGAPAAEVASPAPFIEPTIRSNFADTALWVDAITTNEQGVAEVELKMPENLTTWKIRAWGMGHGTQVGSGDAEVVTRKNLIVRLQSPRFLVQKDEVVLTANVHNYLATAKECQVVLELAGGMLQPADSTTVTVRIPADGEQRVDWRVHVLDEGIATIRMKALTDEESDATELKLPCQVHGTLKTESWAGTVRPEQDRAAVSIRVPAERRVPQTLLEVRYSPTLAAAMVDALPYLVEYPYGCTEQTLNRFLPTVVTQKVLREMNLNLDEIRAKRTNLNAQEIGDDVERAKQWKRYERNPVFDPAEVDRMVKSGVTALTNMQVNDGGWGWFSGWGERSFPHTTAVVVHGLQIARENDVAIVPGVLERGIEWLTRYQVTQIELLQNAAKKANPAKSFADDLDALVYMILVDAGTDHVTMREFLYRDRNRLSVYAKAILGLALHKVDDREKLAMVQKNIEQFLVEDAENETAYLRLPEDNYWWSWYGSDVEANAYYLKLLARTNPKGKTAPRLVKYLLNNRKHGTYWRSTRDTAVCVESFADYLRGSGEAQPNLFVEVWLDGEKQKEVEITGENLFSFDNRFTMAGEALESGEHRLEIRRRGTGSIYFNAYLTNFTLEDPITQAGLEVKVDRKYYRLKPVEGNVKVSGTRGQAVDQRVEKYERELLDAEDLVKSGDLLEIELEIESKNDYEYLIFEDPKAAGCEPFDVRSGYTSGGLGAYMELRDDRITLFVRQLPRGQHNLRFRMRAETPGRFSALPTRASGMYAPELRANSDEIKIRIE